MSRAARTAPTHDRLQQLPQPALPEVPGRGGTGVAGRARGRTLPVPYFHVVFTLPAAIADIAYQNKAVIYDLLFKASAETMLTIAADPSISAPASASPRYCTPGARR